MSSLGFIPIVVSKATLFGMSCLCRARFPPEYYLDGLRQSSWIETFQGRVLFSLSSERAGKANPSEMLNSSRTRYRRLREPPNRRAGSSPLESALLVRPTRGH